MSPTYAFARSILARQSARPTASIISRSNYQAPVTIMAPQKRKQSGPAGFKEDHSKGAMLRFEDSLPKLPVPTLEETSKKYLKSVHALLNNVEYENTKKAVEDFLRSGGQGEELQKRLIARRDDPQHKNWIYEWWNSAAYLSTYMSMLRVHRVELICFYRRYRTMCTIRQLLLLPPRRPQEARSSETSCCNHDRSPRVQETSRRGQP